ncbi:MAG TPA: DUF3566 domain-containing protein [Dermatophilaceae bacterium]|nr:DUF3566 domain-containing protein [Dermatophilaceae bacterium]
MSTAGQSGTTVHAKGSRPPGEAAAGAAPGNATGAGATAPAGPRRVKLSVSRVDPWSVMKLSFLLSVALGIAGVVMITVLWTILSGMGVFADINRTVEDVLTGNTNNAARFDLMDFIGLGRVISLSIVIGVIDVILMTAISTLGAFLYNVCSSLVGGLQLTLTDD